MSSGPMWMSCPRTWVRRLDRSGTICSALREPALELRVAARPGFSCACGCVEGGGLGQARVVRDVDAVGPGPCVDLTGPAGPRLDELLGHGGDAGEFVVRTVLFHADAEAVLQVPCESRPVPGAHRFGPHEGRVLMVGAVFSVVAGARDVEAHDVGVEMRFLLAVFAVLEHCRDEVGGVRHRALRSCPCAGYGRIRRGPSVRTIHGRRRYGRARSPCGVRDPRSPRARIWICRRRR